MTEALLLLTVLFGREPAIQPPIPFLTMAGCEEALAVWLAQNPEPQTPEEIVFRRFRGVCVERK